MNSNGNNIQWKSVAEWGFRIAVFVASGSIGVIGTSLWETMNHVHGNERRIAVIEASMQTKADALEDYKIVVEQVNRLTTSIHAVQLSLPSRKEFESLQKSIDQLHQEVRALRETR